MGIDRNEESGLYKGELNTLADLAAIPYADLTKSYQYFIGAEGAPYFWDASALTGDVIPNDKPPVPPEGYWIKAGGAGGGVSPLQIVQISSADVTTYTAAPDAANIYYEVDTTDADVTFNLPPIAAENTDVYVANIGTGVLTVVPTATSTVNAAASLEILQNGKYKLTGDFDTSNWFVPMLERDISAVVDDYIWGFVVDVEQHQLFLHIISMVTTPTVDLAMFNVNYTDGAPAVHTTNAPIINMVQPAPDITVTL